MNSTIDTSLESARWRNALQAVSLVCGLALAAVLAFGMPDLRDSTSRTVDPVAAAPASAPEYPLPRPVVLYLVDTEADRLALESSLNERTLLIASGEIAPPTADPEVVIHVAPSGQSPYHIFGDEIDPGVQIVDLTEAARGGAQ